MFDVPSLTINTYNEWEGRNRTMPVHLETDDRYQKSLRNKSRMDSIGKPVAPPLSAYLADSPGPRAYYDNDHSQGSSASMLTPEMSLKLEKLRSIRTTGYYTLAPIGVNKTMAQLDFEAQEMEDEDCNVGQAENLNANVSTTIYQDAPSGMPDASAEHDLDADIEDVDASGSFQASSDLSDDDDAVGARDERRVFNPNSGSLTDTQVVGVSASTAETDRISPPVLNCDASDVDMVIEDD
ncbi:hypothetical protein C7M61_000883 [Candidozyma pseudohaemuli]|uniref:Uncharacterized protein n=1 Tax=Candidozyma pseudohaemuli TaxID=418784 RepID=A0A2P7YZ11_9ASCO|nr:hypothetical protein C7M61_000883 [[Candida] pseudohaemulonii]PSK41208.1 hypothetical protein C7M61_000883 [[Candida] pseudohaemulonii]